VTDRHIHPVRGETGEAASFGLVIGLSTAVGQFALALAPGLFGVLHDATGGYGAVLVVCMALQLAAAALVLRQVRTRRGWTEAG
jgi:cyanate permease